jgi:hypothetical protein
MLYYYHNVKEEYLTCDTMRQASRGYRGCVETTSASMERIFTNVCPMSIYVFHVIERGLQF